jgi:hypothetical protein
LERCVRQTIKQAVVVLLAVAFVLSANARSLSFDPIALSEVISAHAAEHGHTHGLEDRRHALTEHANEIIDYDHNMPLLVGLNAQRRLSTIARLRPPNSGFRAGPTYLLDRPPRG